MNNAIRFPLAAFLGLIVTMAVFWFLWVTVSGHHGFAELRQSVKIDFSPLRHDTETETKREKVQQQKPEKMPEIPQLTSSASNLSSDNSIGSVLPTFDRSNMGQISIGADRDVVPLVRINPEYPTRARERGIEGWVQVEFTITAAGTVSDAKVVDADPKGLFERAALEAIGRWKYNPKVVDGRAMERRGVQVVLTFKLEK
jgi:periplasmic protein TonB